MQSSKCTRRGSGPRARSAPRPCNGSAQRRQRALRRGRNELDGVVFVLRGLVYIFGSKQIYSTNGEKFDYGSFNCNGALFATELGREAFFDKLDKNGLAWDDKTKGVVNKVLTDIRKVMAADLKDLDNQIDFMKRYFEGGILEGDGEDSYFQFAAMRLYKYFLEKRVKKYGCED